MVKHNIWIPVYHGWESGHPGNGSSCIPVHLFLAVFTAVCAFHRTLFLFFFYTAVVYCLTHSICHFYNLQGLHCVLSSLMPCTVGAECCVWQVFVRLKDLKGQKCVQSFRPKDYLEAWAVKLVCVCVRATQQGRHGAAMLPGASITVATCIFKYVCHLILVCECNILIYFVYFSASAETCVANVCTFGGGHLLLEFHFVILKPF